jgi:hypothetical protein
VVDGGSISSKMDGVEGASDFVRCQDVRSCAIDYAIRRIVTICCCHNEGILRRFIERRES